MRVPFGTNTFDNVFNFFTSFGYFDDPSEDHKVVNNIYSALKPGGVLVMDYINSAYAEKKLVAAEEKEIDGIIYNITRWTSETHFFKRSGLKTWERENLLSILNGSKSSVSMILKDLFTCNGLQPEKVYGDYYLNEYDVETSPRLILIAKKLNSEKNRVNRQLVFIKK